MASQAFAEVDCDAAADKFVKSVPSGPMEPLGGKTMAEALQDVDQRWSLTASFYIGAVLVFTASPERKDVAENLLALDVLLDCWLPADDAGSESEKAAAKHFLELFPPERRQEIRTDAKALL